MQTGFRAVGAGGDEVFCNATNIGRSGFLCGFIDLALPDGNVSQRTGVFIQNRFSKRVATKAAIGGNHRNHEGCEISWNALLHG